RTYRHVYHLLAFLLYPRPHRPTLLPFPTRRSSDLCQRENSRQITPLAHGPAPQFVEPQRLKIEPRETQRRGDEKDQDQWYPIRGDRKSTRLNSSHQIISYAVFCLKKKTSKTQYSTS